MTSVVNTSVKFAVSSMQDAPVINGTAGSLIAALDAFLVNGFANKQVTSGEVSGGVCRLNFSGQSAAMAHSVILVAGITGANAVLNGEQKVTAVSSSWVEFKTDLPDGAVTGSISFKMAPLGWEKVFTGTNKAVYRQTDPASTRTYYRVDDSNALYARVQMYESMTDVDMGIAVAPLTVAGGYYWHKRGSGATAAYWLCIGNSRGFYLVLTPSGGTAASNGGVAGGVSCFAGDLQSLRSGDAWSAVLTGAETSAFSTQVGCVFSSGGSGGFTLKRAAHGLGGAIQTQRRVFGNASVTSGMDAYLGAFPSPADNGLHLSRIMLTDGVTPLNPRGHMPGAYHCPQSGGLAGFGPDVVLTKGQGEFVGKHLLSTHTGSPSQSNQGLCFFDATGPWGS